MEGGKDWDEIRKMKIDKGQMKRQNKEREEGKEN
jgi:hypothetical protein